MRRLKEFPYPQKTMEVTVYGRPGCPYCDKMKDFLKFLYPNNRGRNYVYYNIFDIIDNGLARDISDFRRKMKIYIGEYSTVPIVFIKGDFKGGYDNFCKIVYDRLPKDDRNIYKKIFAEKTNLNNKKKIINKLDKCEKIKSMTKKKSK